MKSLEAQAAQRLAIGHGLDGIAASIGQALGERVAGFEHAVVDGVLPHILERDLQLVEIEAAFKNLKDDLQLRPIFHSKQERIEAHIFVAFLAYCLQITLKGNLRKIAPGLTPRAVLEKFAMMQLIDVHFPTTDNRMLIFTRYTQPDKEHKILLTQLGWQLPEQSPPRITAEGKLGG